MTADDADLFVQWVDAQAGHAAERAIVAIAFFLASHVALRAARSVDLLWIASGDASEQPSHETAQAVYLCALARGRAREALLAVGAERDLVEDFLATERE